MPHDRPAACAIEKTDGGPHITDTSMLCIVSRRPSRRPPVAVSRLPTSLTGTSLREDPVKFFVGPVAPGTLRQAGDLECRAERPALACLIVQSHQALSVYL